MVLTEQQLARYERDGFLVLDDFITKDQCVKLSAEVDNIVRNVVVTQDLDSIPVYPLHTPSKEAKDVDMDYFLKSGNKIRLFMDKKYVPISGSATLDEKVKEIRKHANKIGHALHALNPVYKDVSCSSKVKDVCKSLGYRRPIVCQSMHVLKQAFSEPNAPGHQDAAFLHVEPNTLIGLWVAVEDSTADNGCLQFIPGSHKGGLRQNVAKNNDKLETKVAGDVKQEYGQNTFVSVPIKAGSAILINGLVVHRSTSHATPVSRDVYAFHIYDSAVSSYSNDNWMSYTPETFLPLY